MKQPLLISFFTVISFNLVRPDPSNYKADVFSTLPTSLHFHSRRRTQKNNRLQNEIKVTFKVPSVSLRSQTMPVSFFRQALVSRTLRPPQLVWQQGGKTTPSDLLRTWMISQMARKKTLCTTVAERGKGWEKEFWLGFSDVGFLLNNNECLMSRRSLTS